MDNREAVKLIEDAWRKALHQEYLRGAREMAGKAKEAIGRKVENEYKWGHCVLDTEKWWLKGMELVRDQYIDKALKELEEQNTPN